MGSPLLLGLPQPRIPNTNIDPMEALHALLTGGGDANNPIKLAALRGDQADEMRHNVELERSAPTVNPGGNMYGGLQTTGRQLSGPNGPGMKMGASGATPGDVASLEGDIKADPFTGDQAQSDQHAAELLHQFLTNPDQIAKRDQGINDAGRQAQATSYGTEVGKLGAEGSAVGSAALNAASGRKVTETLAGQGIMPTTPGTVPGGGAAPTHPTPGPNADMSEPVNSPQGQAILSQADPATANIVKAILEYRFPVPGGYALARSPQMRNYVLLANQIDPEFDATKYESGQKLRDSVTSGPLGAQLQSFNKASAHLIQLDRDRGELGNWNTGGHVLNGGINGLESLLGIGNKSASNPGEDKYTRFNTTINNVSGEIAKFIAGAGGASTDSSRAAAGGGINANSTDADIQAYIHSMAELMKGQLGGMMQQAGGLKHLEKFLRAQIGAEGNTLLQFGGR